MATDQVTLDDAQRALLLDGSEHRAGPPGPATQAVLDEAEAMTADGRPQEAVDLLIARHRDDPHPALERAMIPLRFAAGQQAANAEPPAGTWPPEHPDLWPGTDLVEVPVADLTSETLGSAFVNHGCLIVRGAIDPATAERLRANIDRAFVARELLDAGEITPEEASPWFVPTEIGGKIHQAFGRANYVRAIDSPRGMEELLEAFQTVGVLDAARGYLGERFAFSAHKANLRRTVVEGPNTPPEGGDYHQDGAFLGDDSIRTVNIWMSLSTCGEDAPSIDLVPRRLDGVQPTGVDGALFDWTVSTSTAEALAGDAGILRPHFEPGDLLLFDDRLLHRTGYSAGMTQNRYATETWLFATSTYPDRQVPILV